MKKKIITSLIWKFLERGGTQIVQFIIQIVLARLLLPDDYGVIAIVTVFIAIANVFVQSGFNTSLIQKEKVDDVDFSSVFYLSLFVALILYIIIFYTSPFIADFYNQPILVPVFRVLSLVLFFGAVNSIQQAVVARNLQFKKYFLSSIGGILLSSIIGIVLAYNNFGVWALVAQQLINNILIMIILWLTVKWRPKLMFSFSRLKELFSYGWKLLCSALIDTIYRNIYDLVIGKKYSSASLAYYNKGKQFPSVIIQNIDSSINSVMLPALSKEQNHKEKIKRMMQRSIVTSCYIVFPIAIGLVVIAEPMVKVVLTDKWIDCVPFIQLLSITYALWPIHTANLQAINALGRSDIYLKLEVTKKIIGIGILLLTLPMGLIPMAVGQVISGIIASFVNSYPNKKLLNYSYLEQIKDIIPSLLTSIIMGIVVYSIKYLNLSSIIILIIQVFSGMAIYLILSIVFKLECFKYLLKTIKEILNTKKFNIKNKC